jgi:hypothetical protein
MQKDKWKYQWNMAKINEREYVLKLSQWTKSFILKIITEENMSKKEILIRKYHQKRITNERINERKIWNKKI